MSLSFRLGQFLVILSQLKVSFLCIEFWEFLSLEFHNNLSLGRPIPYGTLMRGIFCEWQVHTIWCLDERSLFGSVQLISYGALMRGIFRGC